MNQQKQLANGQTDKRTNGQTDKRTNGQTDKRTKLALSGLFIGISAAAACVRASDTDPERGSEKSAVMQARSIDTTYRDVGWYGPRDEASCTATALSDTIVLSAAHCQEQQSIMTIGVNDQFDDAEIKRRDLTFRIDLDGDLSTAGDTYTYDVGRVYHVQILDQNRGRVDVELIGLRLPPGVIGPKTRANAKQRRMLTSFRDNVTPPDLSDLVFHAQFNPLTTFSLGTALQVMRPGVGRNDVVFGPDGGILQDATSALLPDGGVGGFGAKDTLLRFVAPGIITGMNNYPGAPSGTLFGDTVMSLNARALSAQSAYGAEGDSGGPMFVSSFPNLPANTDAILGVQGSGDTALPLPTSPPETSHGVFFRDPIGSWIEGRLRDLKTAAASDPDYDGIPSSRDNCLNTYNPNQENTNFETEYELKCRAGTCPPNNGAAPAAGATAAAIATWRSTFAGDACDTNGTARLSLDNSPITTPVTPATNTCTRYDDYGDSRVPVANSTCYYVGENDELISEGRIGATAALPLQTQLGNVLHFGCDCPSSIYVNITNENGRMRECQRLRNCQIARDSAQPPENLWKPNRFNNITEAGVVSSQNAQGFELTFHQADTSTDSLFRTNAAKRRASWALDTDFARMGAPSTGTYEGMLWSYASIKLDPATGAANPAAANTPNDYALNLFSRQVTGLTSYKPLIAKSRIPWYEWIMNPDAHRNAKAEIMASVQQVNNGGVRVFGFSERRTRETGKRFTAALRTQLAATENGSVRLALPSAQSRPLRGDALARGFVVNSATGAITGRMPVLAAATHDVAGAYDYTALTDNKVLGSAVTAALYDTAKQVLVVADASGALRQRSWNGSVLGNWARFGPTTAVAPSGIVHIAPIQSGYRTVSMTGGKLYIHEFTAAGVTEVAKWGYSSLVKVWVNSGAKGEIAITLQREGGTPAAFVFGIGATSAYKCAAPISGPATIDESGRFHVLVNGELPDNTASLIPLASCGAISLVDFEAYMAGQ